MAVITGLIWAGLLTSWSVEEWSEKQTITTLDSIAAPIKDVQFPSVTVCPERFTKPDNWALPQLVLNSFAFECYDKSSYSPEFPDCTLTAKIREDFVNEIIKELQSIFMSWANDPEVQFSKIKFEDLFVSDELTIAIQQKNFSIGELKSIYTNNFGIKTNQEVVKELEDRFEHVKGDCKDDGCKRLNNITRHVMSGGQMLLSTGEKMLFGTFFQSFIEVLGSDEKESSLSNAKLYNLGSKNIYRCKDINDIEKRLHTVLNKIAVSFGLPKNLSISLFDIPSMVSTFDFEHNFEMGNKDVFAYSQCQHESKLFDMDQCKSLWIEYLEGEKGHPCRYQESCCHKWTSLMNINLSFIMKILKIATGVGRNWIDYGKLQQTLTESKVSGYVINQNYRIE